jgi:glucuronoarabinoxylan endo-1,4-beta-xylanase
LAPELSGVRGAGRYLTELDISQVDAIAHHMYGEDPENLSDLSDLAELQAQMALPVFQTEMQAGGFDTALLMHHALVAAGASMYLQTALVGRRSGLATNHTALVGLEDGDFVLQDPYYAMRHYARFTDPGWRRLAASASQSNVLASAWVSPENDRLTVVVLNSGTREEVVALRGLELGSLTVARTVFGGHERMAELGTLPAGSAITLPPRSMATARFEGDFNQ